MARLSNRKLIRRIGSLMLSLFPLMTVSSCGDLTSFLDAKEKNPCGAKSSSEEMALVMPSNIKAVIGTDSDTWLPKILAPYNLHNNMTPEQVDAIIPGAGDVGDIFDHNLFESRSADILTSDIPGLHCYRFLYKRSSGPQESFRLYAVDLVFFVKPNSDPSFRDVAEVFEQKYGPLEARHDNALNGTSNFPVRWDGSGDLSASLADFREDSNSYNFEISVPKITAANYPEGASVTSGNTTQSQGLNDQNTLTAQANYTAWMLGKEIIVASIQGDEYAQPERLSQLTEALGIQFTFPNRITTKNQTTVYDEVQRKVQQKHRSETVAVLDTAYGSTFLAAAYEPNNALSTNRLKENASQSGLPKQFWNPFIRSVEGNQSRDEVLGALQSMHDAVEDYLRSK